MKDKIGSHQIEIITSNSSKVINKIVWKDDGGVFINYKGTKTYLCGRAPLFKAFTC